MKTIIDSLFLELGFDVSKLSADQAKAIAKINEFETKAKRAGKGSSDAIKTVGDAFRDLAKDSSIGGAAVKIDTLATKMKALGASASVAGGAGAPLGLMARGLGAILSPASLGVAALGMLGKAAWGFNADMTAMNATLSRNAELAGLSASKLWAMGEAAKTTGGNPAAVVAGIDSLQTSLAGASIGVGDASAQMTGMARLAPYGAHYRKGGFGKGADEESLFKAAYNMYLALGRAKTIAFLTGYGLMSPDQADLAVSPNGWQEYKKTLAKAKAMKTGGGFDAVVRNSLTSQVGLGEKDINAAITAEQAYGGIQQPMQAMVGLLTNIYGILNATLGYIARIAEHITHGAKTAVDAAVNAAGDVAAFFTGKPLNASMRSKMALGVSTAMNFGLSREKALAMIGNMAQESSMDPLAVGPGGHIGLGQWDKSRAHNFAKMFGYQIGSSAKSSDQQFMDQIMFAVREPQTQAAFSAPASSLSQMVANYQRLAEIVNDGSLGRRISFAKIAAQGADSGNNMLAASTSMTTRTANDNRINTRIGDIHVTTPATNGRDFATDFRRGLLAQPLLNANAQAAAALISSARRL